jgi:hypothetical protein
MKPFLRRVVALLLLPALAHAYGYTATDGLGRALLSGLAIILGLLILIVASLRWPQARWLLAWQVPAVVGCSAFTLASTEAGPPPELVLLLLLSLYLTGRTLARQHHLPPLRLASLLVMLVGSGAVLAALFD